MPALPRAATGAALAVGLLAAPAFAHVTLDAKTAVADSTQKMILQIGHGCDGKPTTAIRVKIPEGVIAVKPMPKPGWELATVEGRYARAYDYFGTPLSEGVTEIAWTGGELPDAWYDEFAFRGRFAGLAPGAVVHFPVVQECAGGAVHRWIEIPAPGQDAHDLEEPAPAVTIVAKPGG